MHFAFILKTRLKDGKTYHMPWQRYGSTRKEAEKQVRASFERDNIYAPGLNGDHAALEDVLDAGECQDGIDNSIKLYEAACAKAAKLDAKANPSSTPAQG